MDEKVLERACRPVVRDVLQNGLDQVTVLAVGEHGDVRYRARSLQVDKAYEASTWEWKGLVSRALANGARFAPAVDAEMQSRPTGNGETFDKNGQGCFAGA